VGYDAVMTKGQINAVLEAVRSWPQEDQEELAEVAREIEARRQGVYVLSDEERAAIEEAERSGIASDEDVARFWKRHGVS
jgi:LDH2 family malate/lactate/ureidoglycolate dehydrogenase